MPRGKVHDQYALLSLAPTFVVGYLVFKDIGLSSTLTLSTLISALLLSPDLDTKSSNYYRWGFFRYLWVPYRKLIPHRSRLSHSLIVAPVLKIIYLLLIISALVMISGLLIWGNADQTIHNMINTGTSLYKNYMMYIYACIIGLFWANMQHIILDVLVSKYFRHFKKV